MTANAHTGLRAFYAQGEKLVGPARIIARILWRCARDSPESGNTLCFIDGVGGTSLNSRRSVTP